MKWMDNEKIVYLKLLKEHTVDRTPIQKSTRFSQHHKFQKHNRLTKMLKKWPQSTLRGNKSEKLEGILKSMKTICISCIILSHQAKQGTHNICSQSQKQTNKKEEERTQNNLPLLTSCSTNPQSLSQTQNNHICTLQTTLKRYA